MSAYELSLGAAYALKAAGVFAVIMIVAMSGRRTHHPYDRFGPANQITTVRALLVALTAALVGEPRGAGTATAALAFGTFALGLDGLDGWIARRTRMTGAFGARFDMEVDALLIQVLAILVWQHGKAGAWVLASGLWRYAFVAAGRLWPWLRRPLFASQRRRIVCAVQIAGLLLALLPAMQPPVSSVVAAVSLAALSYSFVVDTVWLWRRR